MMKNSGRTRGLTAALAVALALLLATEASAVQGAIDKLKQFGGTGDDVVEGIVAGKFSYLAGHTSGIIAGTETNAGGVDGWVRKQRGGGRKVWVHQFGTGGDDNVYGVATGGGVYVVGSTSGTLPGQNSGGGTDAFVRKYKADGTEAWTRQFGSNQTDIATDVSVDAAGDVYVVGHTAGSVKPGTPNTGLNDFFVRKYTLAGNVAWTQQVGSIDAQDDMALAVAVDGTGVYVAGRTSGDLPGQDPEGGVDAFMRKYTLAGAIVANWFKQFGTAADDQILDIDIDGTNLAVAGDTTGTFPGQPVKAGLDAWTRLYNTDGVKIWTRQMGSLLDDAGTAVRVDSNGVTLAAWTEGEFGLFSNQGGEDVILRTWTLAGSGADQLLLQWGEAGDDRPLALDGTAAYLLTAGQTSGKIVGTASNLGGLDAWWGKILLTV